MNNQGKTYNAGVKKILQKGISTLIVHTGKTACGISTLIVHTSKYNFLDDQ